MNLQQQDQFYQAMSGLKRNSRAASSEARVTQVLNGIICSKAAATTKEPEITNLSQYARSASIQGINKMKVIQDFINRKH